MTFTYQRRYRGKLQAAILDWAGTVLDFGCMAPAQVFVAVFERQGVPVTLEEARGPMGTYKRVHIETMTRMPGVAARWRAKHGRAASEADIDRMYEDFVPLQLKCLSEFSTLIPGALDAVAALRQRGLKIGTTTGYSREMVEINLKDAAVQGYRPDHTVAATEVPAGRPSPAMALLNVIHLGLSPVEACVKVDDTRPGIEEGLNAGMWTIGLAVSGNEVGLPLGEWRKLSKTEQERLREGAATRLYQSGAHYVVDSIADIMPCIDDIEARLARGERP
jgi:phosphonoacetaldehyde hydrolase